MKNEKITIDRGVPVPPKAGRDGYPYAELEIGESFFVPNATTRQFSSPSQARKRLKRGFTVRTVEGGIRVWRTS